MRFIHCSDIHLGTCRFGTDHLAGDFALAFERMAEDAVRLDADAVIISGDFFNKANVEPPVLLEAERILGILKEAEIEVIAVEGNHDTSVYGNHFSWMEYLSHKGFLKLLQTKFVDGRVNMVPWSEEAKKGAYIDISGVRFYGLGYLAASSGKKLELFEKSIGQAEYSVAMIHAGVDMFNDMDMGGVSQTDLDRLKGKIDYIALGHIHSRYEIDGWMFNPGGLENWKAEECLKKKGYYVVDVNGGSSTLEWVDSVRRPGHVLVVEMGELNNDSEVEASIKNVVEGANILSETKPIVSVKLAGKAKFDTVSLDMGKMKNWIMERTGAAECVINDRTSFDIPGSGFNSTTDRQLVEGEVIGALVGGIELGMEGMTLEEKIDLVLRYKSVSLQPDMASKNDLLKELLSSVHAERRPPQ